MEKMGTKAAFYAIAALLALSAQADASVQVTLSTDPVNCNQPFKVEAAFGAATANMKAAFYIDNSEYAQVNLNGPSEASAGFSGDDWDRVKPGRHRASVALYRGNELLDEGSAEFEVAGWKCPLPDTTTTTARPPPVACRSNSECPTPVTDTPRCTAENVTQAVKWGECQNPGTPQASCVMREDLVVVETCGDGRACEAGACVNATAPQETTTSSTASTTSTSETSTSTTQEPATTTYPRPQETTTTSTTQPMILQRTNTNLDRIIELIERIILFIFPR
jgi:hypothetical protein